MANHKPPRAASEVRALAARWRAEWAPNDGIDPWLRRHIAELTGLIRNDRWSWADLTRALNDAGILHATGRPWSVTHLSSKVRTLRTRQRRTSPHSTPQDLAVALREALAATAGGFANITINLPAAAVPLPESATNASRRRADAAPVPADPAGPPQGNADDPQAESDFSFGRLKDLSPPASQSAAADQSAPAAPGNNQDVERVLQEFLSRPRRGSIPMPPVLEPEDE